MPNFKQRVFIHARRAVGKNRARLGDDLAGAIVLLRRVAEGYLHGQSFHLDLFALTVPLEGEIYRQLEHVGEAAEQPLRLNSGTTGRGP